MSGNDPESLGHGELVRETEKAVLVRIEYTGRTVELWIPKSVLHDDSEITPDSDIGDEGEVIVKFWWAEANGPF